MAKHILLAEDSVTMQKAIEMTLAGEDVTLTVTATVDEALARARQRRPDLVLADLSLPGKNGYDLAAAIKQEDRSIPVLLLHGSAVTFDPQRAMRSGAEGEVVKPFETQELIDRVNALLEGTDAIGMSGPVEPLGEPLSAATMAPAGALTAGGVVAGPAYPRRRWGWPPLGTISTAPGTGSGVLLPPDARRWRVRPWRRAPSRRARPRPPRPWRRVRRRRRLRPSRRRWLRAHCPRRRWRRARRLAPPAGVPAPEPLRRAGGGGPRPSRRPSRSPSRPSCRPRSWPSRCPPSICP
ncbi:MAG: response regulator [Proteobacteria bacterium]|nr:response regulator [Pseudomonadota bacterium]